jgi:hypothetical protein
MSFGNHKQVISPQGRLPLRVGHENVHAVFGVLLIFAFCLEHEPLQDVIVPRDDAGFIIRKKKRNLAASERTLFSVPSSDRSPGIDECA